MTTQTTMRGYAKCPRCGRLELRVGKDRAALNALSRVDNKTYVCSSCGTAEAFERNLSFYGWDTPPEVRTFMDPDRLNSVEVQGGLVFLRRRGHPADTWSAPHRLYEVPQQ